MPKLVFWVVSFAIIFTVLFVYVLYSTQSALPSTTPTELEKVPTITELAEIMQGEYRENPNFDDLESRLIDELSRTEKPGKLLSVDDFFQERPSYELAEEQDLTSDYSIRIFRSTDAPKTYIIKVNRASERINTVMILNYPLETVEENEELVRSMIQDVATLSDVDMRADIGTSALSSSFGINERYIEDLELFHSMNGTYYLTRNLNDAIVMEAWVDTTE